MSSALAISVALAALGSNPAWPPSDPETPAEALTSTAAMPDDPDYRPRADVRTGCSGQLGLYSFVPDCARTIAAAERPLGTGVHADRAWLWTTGRPDARIAFLDEGIDWADQDLTERIALNAGGELPPPGDAPVFDVNGDGSFDVRDWVDSPFLRARSDQGDLNNNGFLDPQDLLMLFADDGDQDRNGYADDIAGWDFIDGDPDPGTSTTSPLIAAAIATANNGIGGAGACPGCSAIVARVSSSGIASGNELGAAIAYAVDRGARLIATSASSAGGSTFVRRALAYASERGVLMVASAGYSGTPLREGPWASDRVLIVGSIGFDDLRIDRARTALAPDPCSGYGKQLSLSAPGRCDVRAVGIAAGALGLVISTSLGIPSREVPAIDPPLSARELFHLAITGADDVKNDRIKAGFDARTGFGRLNARAAVDAVIRRRVPPTPVLLLPEENAVLDPTPGSGIAVSGRVSNVRSNHASWVLEWAIGREPDAASFSAIGSGTLGPGEGADVAGLVPTLSIFADPTAPPSSIGSGDFEITIRLVTTAAVGAELARAEARRVVSVHRDLELLPAFPIALEADAIGAARAIDLDRDGAEDIAIALDDGTVFAVDVRGRMISGFPILLPPSLDFERHRSAPAFAPGGALEDVRVRESVLATLSAGPIREAERDPALVIKTHGGRTLLYDRSGGLLHDRAATPERLLSACSAVLEDLDGDSEREVVIVEGNFLYAFRSNGTMLAGYPVELSESTGSIAVGDVDRDGTADIALAGRERAFLLHGKSGTFFVGWPVTMPPSAAPAPLGMDALRRPATALGDVDRDGRLDVVIAARGSRVIAFDGTGRTLVTAQASGLGEELALGDLDEDGLLDVVRADERSIETFSLKDGVPLSRAPFVTAGHALGGAAIADIDGDGLAEAIYDAGDGTIEAMNADGTRPRLWPKLTGDSVLGAPQLGDLDGDGMLEVVVVTRAGRVFAWRTRAEKSAAAWAGARHDSRATGNVETPVAVLTDLSVRSGCSCSSAASGFDLWMALMCAIVVVRAAVQRPRRGAGANRR